MRIGIVINKSWNIFNFRLNLLKELMRQGHTIIAIAPEDEYSSRLIDAGCEFIPVKMEGKGSNPLSDILLHQQLYNAYKSARLEAVLHFTIKPNIYGTLAAKRLGIPSINNVSGLGTVFLHHNITSKIAHSLYRFAFRFPRKVFFQNKDDRALFLNKKLVREEITDLLPGSGIDLNYFQPSAFKRNKQFTFLMIARLLYDKGLVEYVEAARILKKQGLNFRSQLLGFTDYNSKLGVPQSQLENWIKEGVIEYLGTSDDVRPFISEADCVVLPSYREGTPRTLLEAAAMGKPLIASEVAGCVEVVKHNYNGLLCKVKDSEDLAKSMRALCEAEDKTLINFSENSRKLVEENFDERIVFEKYIEILNQI